MPSVSLDKRFPSLQEAALQSPPISPAINLTKEPESQAPDVVEYTNDPPLFSSERSSGSEPLFASSSQPNDEQSQAIESHIAKRRSQEPESQIPTREEYDLVVSFKSNLSGVVAQYNANPQAYIDQCLDELNLLPRHCPRATVENKPRSQAARAPTRRNRVARPADETPEVHRPKRVRRTPARELGSAATDNEQSPQPEVRTVMSRRPPKTTPTKDDTDFKSIPDYSPPLSTLAPGTKMKVDWKGQALNLANDPHRHLLHEAEVGLASSLRLTGAVYLTCKRRIFQGHLHLLREGKLFRKTHAQMACKVDVNKASQLHAAFDRVGWFETKWMLPYLNDPKCL